MKSVAKEVKKPLENNLDWQILDQNPDEIEQNSVQWVATLALFLLFLLIGSHGVAEYCQYKTMSLLQVQNQIILRINLDDKNQPKSTQKAQNETSWTALGNSAVASGLASQQAVLGISKELDSFRFLARQAFIAQALFSLALLSFIFYFWINRMPIILYLSVLLAALGSLSLLRIVF